MEPKCRWRSRPQHQLRKSLLSTTNAKRLAGGRRRGPSADRGIANVRSVARNDRSGRRSLAEPKPEVQAEASCDEVLAHVRRNGTGQELDRCKEERWSNRSGGDHG